MGSCASSPEGNTSSHANPVVEAEIKGNATDQGPRWQKTSGKGGLELITLKTMDGANSCEIYSFGATVTSWKTGVTERIFVSDQAIYDGKKAIRGGIPVVFPQFGRPDETMAQHGFARTSNWDFLRVDEDESGGTTAVFALKENESTLKVWPFPFNLEYKVTIVGNKMSTSLQMKNTGTDAFNCQALLHTYLRVNAIENVLVEGFKNVPYFEKVGFVGGVLEPTSEGLTEKAISQEVDRIYTPSSDTYTKPASTEDDKKVVVKLHESVRGYMTTPISVTATACKHEGVENSQTTPIIPDCVLWNLWADKAIAMGDMQDNGYLKYVCVEPGLVAEPHLVQPGDRLTLSQTLTS